MTFEQFTDLVNSYRSAFEEITKLELIDSDFKELSDHIIVQYPCSVNTENVVYCCGVTIHRGSGPYNYIAEVEDSLRYIARSWIIIPDKYLKRQAGVKYSHKCTCESYNLFHYGCKCGGV